MSQVIARKYRPQTFSQVLGQDTVVTTLKNAIRQKRLANAYLFSGSRGTGKTTLARILAKALNCQAPENEEPCNKCSSCREITAGHSLDVLEIDGASHRGIEDIRQINETVSYASSNKYKIYLIDEVHMLTKEAFNALLKTLEEPPEHVKFLFATTEPHKVLPTILSRCQRFQLNRIPLQIIIQKLSEIGNDLQITLEPKALHMIAARAEGGLRDAESLLDQIISFHGETITEQTVADSLGLVSKDLLFQIDSAGKKGDLAKAFEVSELIFSQGKDFIHFVESYAEHFKILLEIKLTQGIPKHLSLLEEDHAKYLESAALYSKETVLNLLELLVEAMNEIRFVPNNRIYLEMLLLKIMRSHQRVPIESLIKRLHDLEGSLSRNTEGLLQPQMTPTPVPRESLPPPKIAQPQGTAKPVPKEPPAFQRMPPPTKPTTTPKESPNNTPLGKRPTLTKEQESRFDTLLQFSGVELEGKIEKTP